MKNNTLNCIPACFIRPRKRRAFFSNLLTKPRTLASLLAGTFMAAGSLTAATVTLPFYDGFDYAEGNLNAVSGVNWIMGNGSTTFEIAVSNSAALTAPPGYPGASGKGVRRAPSGTARRSLLQFPSITAVDGNVIY